jgi:hypothetical protein
MMCLLGPLRPLLGQSTHLLPDASAPHRLGAPAAKHKTNHHAAISNTSGTVAAQ